MFRFIKQIFISALMYFSNLSSVNSLECVSIKKIKNVRQDPKLLILIVIILYFILLALK